MPRAVQRPHASNLYERDFHAWTQEQARLVRARRFAALDVENIAEELETLGRSDRREIRSRLVVLLAHLLKWQFQPQKRRGSWAVTLLEQRNALNDVLGESPSLAAYPDGVMAKCYAIARRKAALEAGISPAGFPASCPYAPDQILDLDFQPGPAPG